jgi:hypothetical protein
MQSTRHRAADAKPNPKFQVIGGVTPVPNWLFDSKALSSSEKLVAWGYHRSTYGSSTTTDASEKGISGAARLDPKTVSAAAARLRFLGVLEANGKRKDGRILYIVALHKPQALLEAEATGRESTPRVKLSDPRDLTPRVGRESTPRGYGFDTQEGTESTPTIKNSKSRTKTLQDASPRSACSSLSDAEMTSGESVDGDGTARSAAPPESTVPSENEVNTRAEVIGNAELAPLPASNGCSKLLQAETSRPPRPFTKAEINAALICPDGFRARDGFEDLSYDLSNLILPMVVGQPLNKGDIDLDKLVGGHGIEFCCFWAHWLPRKIAAVYERGGTVKNPTGLYRRAVEGHWEVDPTWPQFDEQRHTVAARAEYQKREEARKLKEPQSTSDTFTENDDNQTAEAEYVDELEEAFGFGGSATAHNGDIEPPGSGAAPSHDEADLDFAF